MLILSLFLTFFKIGLFTFGGGYAMLALIESICVEKKKWITQDEMVRITVIAESTPGPIALNCATFVGYKQKGLLGAIAASVGVVLPSFLIIYFISRFLDNFLQITWIASAFKGIKIAVGILIMGAGIKMIAKLKKKPLPVVILACALIAMLLIDSFSLRFSTVFLILIAAAVGLVAFLIGRQKDQGGDET